MTLMVLVTLLVCLDAIWELRLEILAGTLGGKHRAMGLIALQPNLFGGFLALMLAVLVPTTLEGRLASVPRAFFAGTLVVAAVTLMLTFSRGAWIALGAALAYLAAFRSLKLLALLLVLAATASVWVPDAVVDRAAATIERGDDPAETEFEPSAGTRIEQWRALPRMWVRAPLLGYGFKSFQELWGEVGPTGVPRSAHSSIIEFAVEEGLLGILAYAWLVWMLVRSGRSAARQQDDPFVRSLATGVVAAAICLVFLDASGTRFRNQGVMIYLWILSGSLARLGWTPSPAEVTRPARIPVRRDLSSTGS
jgi:O-antigen ligase